MDRDSVKCKVGSLHRPSLSEGLFLVRTAKSLRQSDRPLLQPQNWSWDTPRKIPSPGRSGLVLWFGVPRQQKPQDRAPTANLRIPSQKHEKFDAF